MREILYRPRRLRASAGIRNMVRETQLSVHDFVYPIFVVPGINIRKEIPSLPGQYHLSADQALETARQAAALGAEVAAPQVFGAGQYGGEQGVAEQARGGLPVEGECQGWPIRLGQSLEQSHQCFPTSTRSRP